MFYNIIDGARGGAERRGNLMQALPQKATYYPQVFFVVISTEKRRFSSFPRRRESRKNGGSR